jgi:hypothetical protein
MRLNQGSAARHSPPAGKSGIIDALSQYYGTLPMCTRLSNGLRRISTGPVTLIALAVFVLFTALVLPGQSAQAEAFSGGAGSPDTSFFYAPADLYRMAEMYGAAGRAAYIRARFTFDLIWPLIYLAGLTTAVSWLNSRAFAPASRWQLTNLIPLVGCLFDYLENVSAALVIGRYPARTPVVDILAPAFTALKWSFLAVSFILLLAAGVLILWRWRKGKRP